MDEWYERWVTVFRVPGTPKYLARTPPTILPYADSIYILKHGTKAYREMKKALPVSREG